MKKPIVALCQGSDRYQNVRKSLQLIKKDLFVSIKGKKRVVVKVNFVMAGNPLACTHVDSVRAFLDFVKPVYKKPIAIVEKGVIGAGQGFSKNDYHRVLKDYQVTIGDYFSGGFKEIFLFNPDLDQKVRADFSKQALEADFLVSITPAKTHDISIVTLGLKNIAVGFLKQPVLIHQGHYAFNINLYHLAKKITPHFSIVDATVGMEGDGPAFGIAKKSGWAMSSLDATQADVVACQLMGFDPQKVGYLHYLLKDGLATDDWEKISFLGAEPGGLVSKYKPHHRYLEQLKWSLPPSLKEKLKAKIITDLFQPLLATNLGQKLNKSQAGGVAKKLLGFQ